MSDEQEPRQAKTGSEVRWFGLFAEQAVAADPSELESAIGDFIRDFRLGRDHQLRIEPRGRGMFSVRLEPSPTDGTALAVRIPVGTGGRRASLTSIGWAIERVTSGTPYYTRQFIRRDVAPEEVVRAIVEAYQLLYGDRAKGLRWAVFVDPISAETSDSGRRLMVGNTGTSSETRLSLPDRMIARFREHRLMSFLMAALGLWVSTLLAAGSSHVTVSPLASAAILAGGTVSALLVYLTGVPSLMARGNAEFWGLGGPVCFFIEASASMFVAFNWGLVLLVLFGTRLDR